MMRFAVTMALVSTPALAQTPFPFVGRATDPSAPAFSADKLNASGATKMDWNGGNLRGATINLTPPAGQGPLLSTTQTLTGTNTTGQNFGNNQYIAGDTINLGSGFSIGWSQVQLFGGTGAQGGRIATSVKLRQMAPTDAANPNRNYVGLDAGVEGLNAGGDGGTDLGAGARGAYFGMSSHFRCYGVNTLECTGGEINSFQELGSSTRYKNIFSLVSGGAEDAVQGTVWDTMLAMSAQSGSVGHRDGILIGSMNGQFPVNANGTLVRTIGGAVTNGLDLSTTVFTGKPIATPGFAVDQYGGLAASAVTVTGPLRVGEMTAPATPTAGFVLYVDAADHKLKAKGTGGTVTVLAVP